VHTVPFESLDYIYVPAPANLAPAVVLASHLEPHQTILI
jgi:hypothetical protein